MSTRDNHVVRGYVGFTVLRTLAIRLQQCGLFNSRHQHISMAGRGHERKSKSPVRHDEQVTNIGNNDNFTVDREKVSLCFDTLLVHSLAEAQNTLVGRSPIWKTGYKFPLQYVRLA